ncbi:MULTISPECIES: dCTP deaminase [Henriciella]|jgi:dCTP deaminase|uniref:dCTP deaminase n=1 Tax=Henriciella TaxID=453849 RepID=UPI003513D143
MPLGRSEINELIETSQLLVTPFRSECLRGASLILTLAPRFRRWKAASDLIDIAEQVPSEACLGPIETAEQIDLEPGAFVLASTAEKIGLSHSIAGQLSALSHLARLGVGVVSDASFVGPGYGHATPTNLTLELHNRNPNPVRLRCDMPIAHLRIERVTGEAGDVPASIYNAQDPLVAPMYAEEWRQRLTKSDSSP